MRKFPKLPSSVKSLLLPFFVLFSISLLWGAFNFIRFSTADLVQFGFTPKYIDVVNTSLREGKYAGSILYGQYYFDQSSTYPETVDEVQREPFYPFVMMLMQSLGFGVRAVVYLQFMAMILAITCWAVYCYQTFGWKVTFLFYVLLSLNPVLPFYTSVLYPYAFQFLFLSLGIISLVQAINTRRNILFLLSGISFGLTIYERNTYLFLPLFLAVALFGLTLTKSIKLSKTNIAILLGAAYLVISPWLIRDFQLGVVGMSQMTGYTLGYTYGQLPGQSDTVDEQHYDQNLAEFGTDAGTLGFIDHKVLADGLTYAAADKTVATIVLEKMKSNIGKVLEIVKTNILNYPEMFAMLRFGDKPFISLFDYYVQNVSIADNLVLSYLLFSSAIAGIIIMLKKHRSFAIVGLLCLIYNIAVNTTFVIFDVKYRGAIDLMLYVFAGYFILAAVRQILLYWNTKKSKIEYLSPSDKN